MWMCVSLLDSFPVLLRWKRGTWSPARAKSCIFGVWGREWGELLGSLDHQTSPLARKNTTWSTGKWGRCSEVCSSLQPAGMCLNLYGSWKPDTQGSCSRLCDRITSVTPRGGVAPWTPLPSPYGGGRRWLGNPPARGALSSPALGHPSASPPAITVNIPKQKRVAPRCEYPNQGPWWGAYGGR